MLCAILLITFGALSARENRADAARPTRQSARKTASNLSNQFKTSVSIDLEGVELIQFLEKASILYQFEFFLDRRVNPQTILSGSYSLVTLATALERSLDQAGLSFCLVDDAFLYIGPSDAAAEAQLMFHLRRQEITEGQFAPQKVANRLDAKIDFKWDDYAESRDIFNALGKKANLKFAGYEKTPFDRWRGASFHDVNVTDMLIVLGLGYNVDFKYDAKSGAIKPATFNRTQKATRIYQDDQYFDVNPKKHPLCAFERDVYNGLDVVYVTGSIRNLTLVEKEYAKRRIEIQSKEALDAQSATDVDDSFNKEQPSKLTALVTGNVENATLASLFDYLEKQSHITCVLDESMKEINVTEKTLISCQFNKSDIRKVASAIAKEIDADYEIKGLVVIFRPKGYRKR